MDKKLVCDFVQENMKTIFAYALSRVSAKTDAEDLAEDIILAILSCSDRIKNADALFGYVWQIAANTYKKFLRKKAAQKHTELDNDVLNCAVSDGNFIYEFVEKEELNSLRRELSLLSREYRECTVAYYFDGLSCAETAEKLGISLGMVKYYLFKTRKLLKEGIGMEREFGEKSYKPATFDFVTIFSGQSNQEYSNLFNRRLPGNILLSAYYTPMTVRELSVELGVASAYMDDEVALLEKYGLLIPAAGGKYQTNLIIFTEYYTREFYKSVLQFCTAKIGGILQKTEKLLPQLRKIGFCTAAVSDNRLMWALLWLLMHRGNNVFESACGIAPYEIYNGAAGINYGVNYDEADALSDGLKLAEYGCDSFAGYSGIDEKYFASFADFGVLPDKNKYSYNEDAVKTSLYSGDGLYAVFDEKQLNEVTRILKPLIEETAQLYKELNDRAVKLMAVHAPKNVSGLTEKIITKTLFFRTVGLIGKCAVDSGKLLLPNDDLPAAIFICKASEKDKSRASDDCQV